MLGGEHIMTARTKEKKFQPGSPYVLPGHSFGDVTSSF